MTWYALRVDPRGTQRQRLPTGEEMPYALETIAAKYGYTVFVPTDGETRWSRRYGKHRVRRALLPGMAFAQCAPGEVWRVVRLPMVLGLYSLCGRVAIPEAVIVWLKKHSGDYKPELEPGDEAVFIAGPMAARDHTVAPATTVRIVELTGERARCLMSIMGREVMGETEVTNLRRL